MGGHHGLSIERSMGDTHSYTPPGPAKRGRDGNRKVTPGSHPRQGWRPQAQLRARTLASEFESKHYNSSAIIVLTVTVVTWWSGMRMTDFSKFSLRIFLISKLSLTNMLNFLKIFSGTRN